MEIDRTTLADLAVFDREDEFSVLSKIDFTISLRGRDQLAANLTSPLPDVTAIREVQATLAFLDSHDHLLPGRISNGTLMVVERFFDAQIDSFSFKPGAAGARLYKLLHGYDYSLIRYSLKHTVDLIQTLAALTSLDSKDMPMHLKIEIDKIRSAFSSPDSSFLLKISDAGKLGVQATLEAGGFILYRFKRKIFELIAVFAKLDAWRSMAIAGKTFGLTKPEFVEADTAYLEADKLYHLMLAAPVAYDVDLGAGKNFLFLTGANMAGKSTFIKACGIAVYLAHTGMGVPAARLKLSFFDGILSNINVIDNLARGESYFYNEIKRIKATIQRVSDGRKWLILIDELFKGTNIEDAMRCSTAVVEGLRRIRNSLFILSTHLYEIGNQLQAHNNISFKYFETSVNEGRLEFSYELKNGISSDRLGYVILEREGVVKMLNNL